MQILRGWTRRLERDRNAKNFTDEALRTSDEYDRQEMDHLTEAARQAGAKAKRIDGRKHARAPVAEEIAEAVK